jgi:hypothetical protein
LIIVICGYGFGWGWTGLPSSKVPSNTQPTKTLWDWLDLLIVPAVLAVGGYLFNRQQRERELRIAERRAKEDRWIAKERAHDEALQAYLDKMTELLINHNLGKPEHNEPELQGDAVRTVAWARTKTMLRRLDGNRKGAVLRFLREAELIKKDRPVIRSLAGADLADANLQRSILEDTALEKVILRGAVLSGAVLTGTVLRKADLTGADLKEADLTKTDLTDAQVTEEQLAAAKSLEGATMPNGQTLKGKLNPDGPTFEEWLKSRGKRSSATPEQRGPWWGGPYHRPWWRRMFGS